MNIFPNRRWKTYSLEEHANPVQQERAVPIGQCMAEVAVLTC
jgi:hypothetical protein